MSILIKGMEMPKSCGNCRFSGFGGLRNELVVCMFTGANAYKNTVQYLDDCPLVPVPPHRRLTKRLVYRGEVYNALESERMNSLDGILTDPYKDGFHDGLKRALQILVNEVEDAPTIIEAEVDDEDKTM